MKSTVTRSLGLMIALGIGVSVLANASCKRKKVGRSYTAADSDAFELHSIVGPDGLTIKIDQPRSTLIGLRIEIPAGAFDQLTELTVRQHSSPAQISPGLTAIGPAFEILAGQPLEKDIVIVFPVQSSVREARLGLSGLIFDGKSETWSAEFASAMDKESFAVTTRRLGTWRAGVTQLDKVPEKILHLALEDLAGPHILANIIAPAEELYEQRISPVENFIQAEAQNGTSWDRCSVMGTLAGDLAAVSEAAKVAFAEHLAKDDRGKCGSCDLVSVVSDYVAARSDVAFDYVTRGQRLIAHGVLELAAAGYYASLMNQGKSRQKCDFTCLIGDHGAERGEFWGAVGRFYASQIATSSLPAIMMKTASGQCAQP